MTDAEHERALVLVEIWSDVVCPWCAIGRARFLRTLASSAYREDVRVRYRSFELDPTMPATVEGPYVARLASKYRTTTAQAQAMIDRMTSQAAAEGLSFDFAAARPGNTFDAHRLLHLAADHGVQDSVKARLLTGYLSEGAAIGTADGLRTLATDGGLDGADVDAVLAGDHYADAVRADERQARAYGITGVPFFVFDRRVGVAGAQPPEVLQQALAKVRREAGPPRDDVDHAGHDARSCADGTCTVDA